MKNYSIFIATIQKILSAYAWPLKVSYFYVLNVIFFNLLHYIAAVRVDLSSVNLEKNEVLF